MKNYKVSKTSGLHNRGTSDKEVGKFDFPRICQCEILYYDILASYRTFKNVRHILLYDLKDDKYYEIFRIGQFLISKYLLTYDARLNYLMFGREVRYVCNDVYSWRPTYMLDDLYSFYPCYTGCVREDVFNEIDFV